jgi:hypothetical protein
VPAHLYGFCAVLRGLPRGSYWLDACGCLRLF